MFSKKITFKEFNQVYQESVRTVLGCWSPEMQAEIAVHCRGWSQENFNFKAYLEYSSVRFYKAYRAFARKNCEDSICDVGGFWGVFPMTLKKLGVKNVTMTESLKYYSNAFNHLFDCIRDSGVTILDLDPFESNKPLPEPFDFITVMAVLEHYPHSLKSFMKNISSMINSKGRLYIEVPNLAYWPKRINLLLGKTPLVLIQDIFNSEVPFIGHHHEFTISELRELVKLSGSTIISESSYNYSPDTFITAKNLIRRPLTLLVLSVFSHTRECFAVLCKKEY